MSLVYFERNYLVPTKHIILNHNTYSCYYYDEKMKLSMNHNISKCMPTLSVSVYSVFDTINTF